MTSTLGWQKGGNKKGSCAFQMKSSSPALLPQEQLQKIYHFDYLRNK